MNVYSNEKEIDHSIKLGDNAENIWNWGSPAGQVRVEKRVQLIIRHSNMNEKSKVLEIGCGTGLFSSHVQRITKCDLTSCDISPIFINQCLKRKIPVKFMIADALHLPFEGNHFDVVFGSSILHHLDIHKVLTETLRVLKPGGRITFAEPNILNPQIFLQKKIGWLKRLAGDLDSESAINRWKFYKIASKIGFKNVEGIPHDFLHPATPKQFIKSVNSLSCFLEKVPIIKEFAGSILLKGDKDEIIV